MQDSGIYFGQQCCKAMKNEKQKPTSPRGNLPSTRAPLTRFPLVSIVTPTFDRRLFIPQLLYMFDYQTYPRNKMELIIADDGSEKIHDLIAQKENVKYYQSRERISLGKKRNFLNDQAKGDIIICWDDDDYYAPEYVETIVTKLWNSNCLLAGKSRYLNYFVNSDSIYAIGPFGRYHTTNASLSYKREYVENHSYNDGSRSGEEQNFLNNFSEEMIQIEDLDIYMATSHVSNTFDRSKEIRTNPFFQETHFTLEHVVKDEIALAFYRNLKFNLV